VEIGGHKTISGKKTHPPPRVKKGDVEGTCSHIGDERRGFLLLCFCNQGINEIIMTIC